MPTTHVDQQTQRRRGTGLIAWDRDGAFPGYTLFTPMMGDGAVYLIDMEGRVAHQWQMPLPPGLYAHRLPNGNVLYCGKTPEPALFPVWPLFKGGAVMEVDWHGRVLWQVEHPFHHHDARLMANGNVLMLCLEEVPAALVPTVRGGIPGSEHQGRMWADKVVEMTRDGWVVWEWHAWEHLDPETDVMTRQDLRHEWTHGNCVEELPDGDILISLRNISTVAIISRATGEFRWRLGPPVLAQQHYPHLLPNGNILVFDNGTHRLDSPFSYSRVLEVNIETKAIVWSYRDPSPFNFFSPYVSGAQRLPNGNTLITEGVTGRLFEVTPQGEVVWEYVSPYFAPNPILGENNWVFRAFRYTEDEIAASANR